VQTDGVQPVSWIEADSGDIRERSTRGMGFGYREPLERPLRPQNQIENDKSVDGRVDIAGSDRTFFDERGLPLGFLRAIHKNSKVTNGV
jgi:hypothetical protein